MLQFYQSPCVEQQLRLKLDGSQLCSVRTDVQTDSNERSRPPRGLRFADMLVAGAQEMPDGNSRRKSGLIIGLFLKLFGFNVKLSALH